MSRYELRYYKLIGKLVVPTSMMDWAQALSDLDARTVRVDKIAGATVSTVFLGLDHGFNPDRPIVFETMIFPTKIWDEYQTRCSTYEQALAMHQVACNLVRKTQRQLPVVQLEENQDADQE